jgi:hypothetical protein
MAKAGFPIQAFELPPAALGNDWFPRSMLGGFIANELFWIGIGFVLAFLFARFFPRQFANRKWTSAALIIGGVFIFLHLPLFVLWFD